jgi:outer membrane protein OmpA-like peptidoglycan-associated protein
VSKGIADSRITAKGFGETELKNQCGNDVKCSEEEHAINRRTEFKILSME